MKKLALVGDIGGTNSRFGLVAEGSTDVIQAQSLKNDDFASLEAVIKQYLKNQGNPELVAGAIDVASPVDEGEITLTNRDWTFSAQSLAAAAQVPKMIILNDYEALALGLPYLTPDDLVLIGGTPNKERAVKLVLGPGTGLGMAALVPAGSKDWQVVASEPGHITLPIETQAEFDWREKMRQPGKQFSAEDAITGGGLYLMYKTIAPQGKLTSPEEVLKAALNGTDAEAEKTLEQFLVWLARIAGDATMIFQARGGLYLAGGMTPSLIDRLKTKKFRDIFEQKGKLTHIMQPIPVYVIVDQYPAFKGCIAALRREQ